MRIDRKYSDGYPNDSNGLPPIPAPDSINFLFCVQLEQLKSISGYLEIIVEYALIDSLDR